jgi:phenylpropionate dioxygenase-like ring-hydroxylating dioxygenase large terminal subunit
MLFGFWYRAFESRALARGKTAKATVLRVALLVGRDARGEVFAFHDACPHKGMPLSYGRFDGETLQCGLHGWRFDSRTGECRSIPACTEQQCIKLGAIRAGRIPCEERDGYLWVYLAEPERSGRPARERAASPASQPPALPLYSERYRHFDLTHEVQAGSDHVLTLLLDAAHGPFVHRRWWILAKALFGLFGVRDEAGAWVDEFHTQYEPIPYGFRERVTSKVPDRWSTWLAGSDTVTVEADFVLPTVRVGGIRFGKYWLTSLHTVTPIDERRCRVDQRVAWEGLYWTPFGVQMMKTVFSIFAQQDKQAMERQAEGLPRIPRLMFVDDFDRPARWYYDLKRALLESRRTGTELRHPLQGPVTLKWRNPSLDL